MNRNILITILLLICAAFAVTGLWPFVFHPDNEVMLLREENGLRQAGVGNALSREPFPLSDTIFRTGSFSLEMLVRPHREPSDDVPAIVTVCAGNGIEYLFIGQWKSTLIIRSPERSSPASKGYREIGVGDALHQDRTRLITVTASEQETVVYLDGEHARTFREYSLLPGSASDLTGYLVIGNVRSARSFWSGDLLGLRIYDHVLTGNEVRLHKRAWPKFDIPPSAVKQGVIAEYDFNRGDAPLAINRTGPLPDLMIAPTFQPVHRTMLELPWERDWRLLPDVEDILINIAGFIPFGFFFAFLLRGSSSLSVRFVMFSTVAAGAAISLTIEITQAYLPMRNSSATDLICNIFGTMIGAIVLIRTRLVPEQ